MRNWEEVREQVAGLDEARAKKATKDEGGEAVKDGLAPKGEDGFELERSFFGAEADVARDEGESIDGAIGEDFQKPGGLGFVRRDGSVVVE